MSNQIDAMQSLTMTSREIAELTGKRHDNVLRDIGDMLTQVYDLIDNSGLSYLSIQGVTVEQDKHTKRTSLIILDKNHTLTLLTGYDAKARFKVVERWQELEYQVAQHFIYRHQNMALAKATLDAHLEAGRMLGCPAHLAQVEAVKQVKKEANVDFSYLLSTSPAQDNIPEEEVMLEVTEIGKRLGFGDNRGAYTNKMLQSAGLQYYDGKEWIATELGKPLSARHAWTKRYKETEAERPGTIHKEGYNLKWNFEKVKHLLLAEIY